jgi:hypothetical protein
MYDGAHYWFTGTSGTAGNAITFTQAMTLLASGVLLVGRTGASGFGKLNVDGGADFTGGNVLMCRDTGNVGIGTTSPGYKVDVYANQNSFFTGIQVRNTNAGSSATSSIALAQDTNLTAAAMFLNSSTNTGFGGVNSFNLYQGLSAPIVLHTNATERMRIDSSGKVTVGSATATTALIGARGTANAPFLAGWSDATSGYTDALLLGEFRGYAPNNSSARYVYCGDNASRRFVVLSNGGIENFQANNVNLSDRREKTNFAPSGEYLSKICAIPVQTFNYIDQNLEEDGGLTLGVVAQDVEAVAPELVKESNWGTQEEPKMRLSIYQTDLQYALMKCIQEQQVIINDLKARIETLETK